MITRPAIFKWRQTESGLILCAVRWYLRYSLPLRDVEELLEERGLNVDHTTVWRWVQYYGPELEQRLRRHLKPTNKSWRVDETYVRVGLRLPGIQPHYLCGGRTRSRSEARRSHELGRHWGRRQAQYLRSRRGAPV